MSRIEDYTFVFEFLKVYMDPKITFMRQNNNMRTFFLGYKKLDTCLSTKRDYMARSALKSEVTRTKVGQRGLLSSYFFVWCLY